MIENILVRVAVLVCLLGSISHALARGGHGGIHGPSLGGVSAATTPAYLIIDATDVSDAQDFSVALDKLVASLPAAGGRILINTDKARAVNGAAPSRFVVMAFDSPEQLEAWKSSDSFKEFNNVRVNATKSRAFIVQGKPIAMPIMGLGRRRGRMGFDMRPFEEIMKRRDEDLKHFHDICRGC
jgi:uncharacterized protein (DUF1330 family)